MCTPSDIHLLDLAQCPVHVAVPLYNISDLFVSAMLLGDKATMEIVIYSTALSSMQ